MSRMIVRGGNFGRMLVWWVGIGFIVVGFYGLFDNFLERKSAWIFS